MAWPVLTVPCAAGFVGVRYVDPAGVESAFKYFFPFQFPSSFRSPSCVSVRWKISRENTAFPRARDYDRMKTKNDNLDFEVFIMNCPKCGRAMQSGFLQAGNIMAFNKQKHKISLNPKDAEDVIIAQKAFTSTDFHGFICKDCGLVVFDYKNNMTRL